MPTPNVVSDIECLEHASSATAAEYTSLLRPLRGREPEGMWNLDCVDRSIREQASGVTPSPERFWSDQQIFIYNFNFFRILVN